MEKVGPPLGIRSNKDVLNFFPKSNMIPIFAVDNEIIQVNASQIFLLVSIASLGILDSVCDCDRNYTSRSDFLSV